jgi:hypothetical protein
VEDRNSSVARRGSIIEFMSNGTTCRVSAPFHANFGHSRNCDLDIWETAERIPVLK